MGNELQKTCTVYRIHSKLSKLIDLFNFLLHITAVGCDTPGKNELSLDLVKKADFLDRCYKIHTEKNKIPSVSYSEKNIPFTITF